MKLANALPAIAVMALSVMSATSLPARAEDLKTLRIGILAGEKEADRLRNCLQPARSALPREWVRSLTHLCHAAARRTPTHSQAKVLSDTRFGRLLCCIDACYLLIDIWSPKSITPKGNHHVCSI